MSRDADHNTLFIAFERSFLTNPVYWNIEGSIKFFALHHWFGGESERAIVAHEHAVCEFDPSILRRLLTHDLGIGADDTGRLKVSAVREDVHGGSPARDVGVVFA